MIDDVLLEAEDKMDKAVEVAREELASIRTGRANASLFTKNLLDYYHAPTPLQPPAGVAIPEARDVLTSPVARAATPAILTSLRRCDRQVTPSHRRRVGQVG